MKQLTLPETEAPPADHMMIHAVQSRPLASASPARSKMMLRRRSSIETIELENTAEALKPQVEGRIFIVDEPVRRSLTKMCFPVIIGIVIEKSVREVSA